jgi:hypothetical protein
MSSPAALQVSRALRVIATHPAVASITAGPDVDPSITTATVHIDTNLPGPWRAEGRSPNGVLSVEPVVLAFTARYPLSPPRVFLREDFDRSHPHLLPIKEGLPPEPCYLAGSTRELMRSRGILGVVGQIADWLERAALVQLIDPAHGWEPTRRDDFSDIIIADLAWLQSLPTRSAGSAVYDAEYTASGASMGDGVYRLETSHRLKTLDAEFAGSFRFGSQAGVRWGSGLVLVAWSGKAASGAPFVADRYTPETVSNVASLHRRAQEIGCGEVFAARMRLIEQRLRAVSFKVPTPLAVILLARRPCHLSGTNSPIEACPYLIEIGGGDDLSPKSDHPVRLAFHCDMLSIPLLRRASGDDESQERPSWTLLGCGSVGSKMAMHMARTGRGPSVVIDRDIMLPHNFARHATLPEGDGSRMFAGKAVLLAQALDDFRQPATAMSLDIISELTEAKAGGSAMFPPGAGVVVNATGSVAVREALAANSLPTRPRVIETCLLGAGSFGYMTVEGPAANPSTADLAVEAYRHLQRDPSSRQLAFSAEAQAIAIGQSCSSLTFPLSDARLSALCAPMAETLATAFRNGPPLGGGELLLGRLAEDGLNQTWARIPIEPWLVVQGSNPDAPCVRLSSRVDAAIRQAVADRAGVETGGVLIGRYADVSNTFHVVDVLPAPPDSRFSRDEFILGKEGLRDTLEDIVSGSGGALYPLGTWHNHLVPSGASATDLRTALHLAVEQTFPVLMLILRPDGYESLVVEATHPLELPPTSGSSDTLGTAA